MNIIFIDDFLTRRWWDEKPYPRGLGLNIAYDYKEITIQEELETIKKVKATGVPFKIFIIGYVLEMAKTNPEIKEALMWCVNNGIEFCGHGYYHTQKEYDEKYVGYVEKVYNLLQEYQKPPYSWRYPREEVVNPEYVGKFFKIEKVDAYLDEEILVAGKRMDVLKGHEHHNAVVHSLYLTRPIRKFYPSAENIAEYEYQQKQIRGHKLTEN